MKSSKGYSLGEFLKLGIYEGTVVDIDDVSITVKFKTWPTINPWTGDYPKITFTHFALLDKEPVDKSEDIV